MDLSNKIKELPNEPGVYMMKDSYNNIIYVGKSKKLRNRVKSYFRDNKNHSPKVLEMVGRIFDIDYIVTDTELEALLLECEMIKDIQPMYNRLMKNYKKYQYIKITVNEEYPRIIKAIDKDDDSVYFGPFTSRNKIDEVIDILKKYFNIRICDTINLKRSNNGCLEYQIGNCIGVCLYSFDKNSYKKSIYRLINFLNKEDNFLFNLLEDKMKKSVDKLLFEDALKYKKEIESLKYILNAQDSIKRTLKRRNLLLIEFLNENMIKIFFINNNKVTYKEIINLNIFSHEKLKDYIILIINKNFSKESILYEMKKEDIDSSFIISSYLKNNSDNILNISIDDNYITNVDEIISKYIKEIFDK